MNDAEGYLEYAQICLQHGEPYPCDALIKGYSFIWNIGIINLIAVSLWLFDSYVPVLLLMCVMKAFTVWLIGQIALKLFNYQTALITIILYICYPNNWGDSTMLLSEIPMIFFALWGIWLIISKDKVGWWLLGGFLLGIANWFRPIAVLFIISLTVYYIIFNRKHLLTRITSIILGSVLFITIVGAESWYRTRHFIYQAETFWFNMVDECYDGSPIAPHYQMEMYAKGTPRYIENREELTCFECSDIWKARSLEWLKEHPWEYLSKIPGRLYYMYFTDYDNLTVFVSDRHTAENNYITIPFRHLLTEASTLSKVQWMSLVSTIFYYFLLFTALLGIIVMMQKRQYKSLFLPLFIVVFGSLSLVLAIHGETRFKIPFMPFIFILSALYMSNIKLKLR